MVASYHEEKCGAKGEMLFDWLKKEGKKAKFYGQQTNSSWSYEYWVYFLNCIEKHLPLIQVNETQYW